MKYVPFFIAILFATLGYSQEVVKCYTDELEEKLIASNPEAANYFANYHQQFDNIESLQKTTATVYKIPVVFHVIYDDATDNISREQILDAIRVLNEDYRRLNADKVDTRPIFVGVAADTEIEFVLAKLDPSGNCTNGITRTQSSLSVDAGDNVKDLVSWDNKKYMNIWTVQSIDSDGTPGTILGYAYKPRPNQSYKYDGIVIRHDRVGTIGTGSGVSLGRTLTHESGHYLGLDHPFRNGCFGGDNCDDTPPVASASYGCNHNSNTCSNDFPDLVDQVENYMDYADDYCMNMFTQDQKSIMRFSLGSSNLRGYLITTNNHQVTGIVDNQDLPCAPVADYLIDNPLVCVGEDVNFEDFSSMGNPTSYSWTFGGGTPSTSTDRNPTVKYNTSGNFIVDLVVTNSHGTSQKYTVGAVSVRPQPPVWINQFSEDFETWDLPNNNWHVTQAIGSSEEFKTTSAASVSGSKSAMLNVYDIDGIEVHELISNVVNLENSKTISLTFKHAYAPKAGVLFGKDALRVYSSIDCGKTWVFAKNFLGPNLSTATGTDNVFVPSASEWTTNSVSFTTRAYEPSVMFKFEFTTNGGNNIYIDDIMLDITLGEKELDLMESSFAIFPNPSNGDVTVGVTPSIEGNISVEVYNINGALVASPIKEERVLKEYQEFYLKLNGLPKGVYVVKVSDDQNTVIKKLIIQ